MGGVASAIGNAVGSVVGGLTGGMADASGITNNFQGREAQLLQQQGLLDSIGQTQAGYGSLQGNQNALAQALLAQSQGRGPNPAQAMLRQATDQNAKQAAGIVSGAKGINPALAARYAGQNAAAANQQAAGQGAVMDAQQQLQAQNSLGSLYGQMGQQNLNQQSLLQSALANQNQANIQNTLGAQGLTAGAAASNAESRGRLAGGLLSGAGSVLGGFLGKADGGFIPGEANTDGDSYSNDTVPAMLSPGEIVVPRSASKDADSAKAFIDHLMKTKGKKRKAS